MGKGINISHVNMGGRDQSQVKMKFKKFEKVKFVPKTYQKVIMMTDLTTACPFYSNLGVVLVDNSIMLVYELLRGGQKSA